MVWAMEVCCIDMGGNISSNHINHGMSEGEMKVKRRRRRAGGGMKEEDEGRRGREGAEDGRRRRKSMFE